MTTGSAAGDGSSVAPVTPSHDGGAVSIADAGMLFLGDYSRHGHDLLIEHDGTTLLVQDYFANGEAANLVGPNGAYLTAAVVEALAGPVAPGQYAQAGAAPSATALVEIGKVVSVEGTATATHPDGVTVDLANGDAVYQGDVVRTGAASKLGISFIDDSVFSLSADARMVLDELVFDPAKVADSSMVVNLVQGSFVFVTGQVAPTGNMKVETPVATMGIRGTTPKVLINTDLGVTEFTILPDPGSGKIGSYVLLDKATGEILGTVESVGDKWVITSLSGEAVKIAKSGLDLLEDERAIADIRDAVSNAIGKRTEYDGSNAFKQVAYDSSASAGNQGDGPNGSGDGHGPGGGEGGPVDPNPDKDDPPIAGDDAFTIDEDSPLGNNVISASGGGPDVDPDGFALTVTQVNGVGITFGSNGWSGVIGLPLSADAALAAELSGQDLTGATLRITATGTFLYDPRGAFDWLAVGEEAIDTFTYTVRDQFGFTDTATVSITVTGVNDAPEITSGVVEREVAESSDVGGATGQGSFSDPDALHGTLNFKDVDITDAGHTFQVIGVDEYPANGTPLNPLGTQELLEMLEVAAFEDSGQNGTTGKFEWKFVGTEDQFDYLAAGESVELVYLVQVKDLHGAVSVPQEIRITIFGASDDGSNDTPVIFVDTSGSDPDTAIGGVTETNAGLMTDGTLTVTDVDLTDVVNVSVVSVDTDGTTTGLGLDSTTLQEMLSLSPESLLTDVTKTSQKFTWTFDSQGYAFDYLAEGEQLVLKYTVQADDGIDTGDHVVTVTITGTNDAPVIEAIADTPLFEQTGTGLLAKDIAVTFSDVDLNDVGHEATITGVTVDGEDGGLTLDDAALIALVTPGTVTKTAGSEDGSVTLAFAAASTVFDYLAVGETVTLTYTVKIDDGDGGKDSQTFDVVITGTNDAPVVAAIADTPLSEQTDTGPLIANIAVSFSDVDLNDVGHSATITGVTVDGEDGGLTLDDAGLIALVTPGTVAKAAGSEDGSVTLAFSAAYTVFDYLANGETVTLTYTVEIDDGDGGTDTQSFDVVITGTNDAPVLTVDATGGVTEDAVTPDLTDSGTLSFADVDTTDVVTPSATLLGGPTWSGGSLSAVLTPSEIAALTANFTVDGNSWDYTVANSLVQFLGEGETITFSYTVTATDDSGQANNSDSDIVTVTVTGVNDAPEIATAATLDFFRNDGARAIDATLTVADVDNADLVGAKVSIIGYVAGDDVLGFVDQNGITGSFDSVTGVLELTGVASEQAYQDALRSVTFLTSATTATDSRTIEFSVDDGDLESTVSSTTVHIFHAVDGTNPAGEPLTGTAGADWIAGLGGADQLFGQGGDDVLFGGGGADQLHGWLGNDQLYGGDGSDTLEGGGGFDEFVFKAGDTGVDTVLDFDQGDDVINIESLLSTDFDPEHPQEEIRLAETAPASDDSILQVNTGTHAAPVWTDVAMLDGVGAGETINVIFDQHHEAISFANAVV